MKSTIKSLIVALATGLIGFGFVSEKAQATTMTINGGIAFKGMFEFGAGTGLADATEFESFSGVTVTAGIDDYAVVPVGTSVTYPATGFSFNPLDPSPVSPLWTFTIAGPPDTVYSFDLYAVTVLDQSPFVLQLGGEGVARITGKEDTIGSWSFMNNGFGPTVFNFTAIGGAEGVPAPAVPEGGSTVAFLGFALLGVETLRRKFKAASARS